MRQLFALNQVLALEALGKHAEALALLDHAQPILLRALGGDAPTYLRVLALRARLEQSRLGRPSRAGTTGAGMIEFFS